MTKNHLELIKNEELEHLESRLTDILTFKSREEFDTFATILTDIDEFINSEEIQDIDEFVLLPMQRLVEISLMIKAYEEQEIGRDLRSKGIYDSFEFQTLRRTFLDEHNDYFLERWRIDLEDCQLQDLRKILKTLLNDIEVQLSQIKRLLGENWFIRSDIIDSYSSDLPLPINILFNTLHCFWLKINDLFAQFDTIQESCNIIYSPIKIDHYLNDREIILISRLKYVIEVIIDNLLDRENQFDIEDMNKILNELFVYPSYHKWSRILKREISTLKDIKNPNISAAVNSFKKEQLNRVYDEEFSKLASFKEVKVIAVEVKEKVSLHLGSNVVDISRYRFPQADNKCAKNTQPTMIYIRSDFTLSTQNKILDLMKDLITNNMLYEAELIHRCYLLLTNELNFNEYNNTEKYFQRWLEAEVYISQFLFKLDRQKFKVLSTLTSA